MQKYVIVDYQNFRPMTEAFERLGYRVLASKKHMTREQFAKARTDAASISGELSEDDLTLVAGGVMGSMAPSVSSSMILGRSISGATGTSFQTLTHAACDCCAWKGGISAGSWSSNPGF